jgi:hypothetical protein
MQAAGSGQWMQREASTMARSGLNSMTTAPKSQILSPGGRRSKSKNGILTRDLRSILSVSLGINCIDSSSGDKTKVHFNDTKPVLWLKAYMSPKWTTFITFMHIRIP